ncbi:hypothetical protein BDZ91DRAFT_711716 [Kalaharituber pfeilii]|nr:hypothetical protein BDZ91DRAFT_711716 [Kalaharituber pfeilii]
MYAPYIRERNKRTMQSRKRDVRRWSLWFKPVLVYVLVLCDMSRTGDNGLTIVSRNITKGKNKGRVYISENKSRNNKKN